MARRTIAEVNLGAECRAVEEGHRCRLVDGQFCVVSDTKADVTYHVGAVGVSTVVRFTCDCPRGSREPVGYTMGVAGCKHAALVARRLEREGLARFDGTFWLLSDRALELTMPRCAEPGCAGLVLDRSTDRCSAHDDPFARLNMPGS